MSQLQQASLKYGISKDVLVEMLTMATKWPFAPLDDCLKEIEPQIKSLKRLTKYLNEEAKKTKSNVLKKASR